MSIWHSKDYSLETVKQASETKLVKHLGIEFTEIGEDYLKATMPVDERTQMPLGLLHGGASCVLAESLASVGAYLCIDPSKQRAVGLEINANHVRSVTSGVVIGIAKPLYLGWTNQVWDIKIYSEQEKLLCVSRMTMATPEV